jgi:hypothetical protein
MLNVRRKGETTARWDLEQNIREPRVLPRLP